MGNSNSSRHWHEEEFPELYAEALAEFEGFQRYIGNTLRECNSDNNPSAIKSHFEFADTHYKEAKRLTSKLLEELNKRLQNKEMTRRTRRELLNDLLARQLGEMISNNMYHLLMIYKPWLAEADLSTQLREDDEE